MEPGKELDGLARRVIGAAIEVHRVLGPGYLESVYEEALAIELEHRDIRSDRQVPVSVVYRGRPVGVARLDMMVADRLVIELKAVNTLLPIHHAQVISYLKATGVTLGLLINFNSRVLRDNIKRIIFTQ